MEEKFEQTEVQSKRDLPIGLGQELIKSKECLPALFIDNEVYWVNPDMQLPFKLEVGESTNLGMFFTSSDNLSSVKSENIKHLEVSPDHKRSGVFTRVIVKDNEGNLYRDFDMKGVGYVAVGFGRIFVSSLVEERGIRNRSQTGPWGLVDLGYALTDKKISEEFLENHIRTYGIVAIIKLKELIQDGKKISIEQARQRRILREDEEPVLEVRAFGTKMRVQDCIRGNAFLDGMYLVAQELGIEPETFTVKDYFSWFCQTLGQQISRMHKLGYVHGYLTSHNITLDCKIVDLDSVTQDTTKELRDKDKEQALETLDSFLRNIKYSFLKREKFDYNLREEFIDAYQKEFNKMD